MHEWNDQELTTLDVLYPLLGPRKTAEKMSRTESSVRNMAQDIGLRYIGNKKKREMPASVRGALGFYETPYSDYRWE